MRINKFLAYSGVASRRGADKLIEAANNAGGHDNVTVALAVNSEKGA